MSGKPTSPVQSPNSTQAAPATFGEVVNNAAGSVAQGLAAPATDAARVLLQSAVSTATGAVVGYFVPNPASPETAANTSDASGTVSPVEQASPAAPAAFSAAANIIATAATPLVQQAADQVVDALAKQVADATVAGVQAFGAHIAKGPSGWYSTAAVKYVGDSLYNWWTGEGTKPTLTPPTEEEIAAAAPAPEAAAPAPAQATTLTPPSYNPFDDEVLVQALPEAAADETNVFNSFNEVPTTIAASDEVPVAGANNPVDDVFASLL